VMTSAPDHLVGGQEVGRGTVWRWPWLKRTVWV
jgi:hypothetical protein